MISPAETYAAVTPKTSKALVLDIRENSERRRLDVGGDHIPLSQLENNIHRLLPYQHELIILCCVKGRAKKGTQTRAQEAQFVLQSNNFTNVRCLEGGLMAYNIAIGMKLPTRKI